MSLARLGVEQVGDGFHGGEDMPAGSAAATTPVPVGLLLGHVHLVLEDDALKVPAARTGELVAHASSGSPAPARLKSTHGQAT